MLSSDRHKRLFTALFRRLHRHRPPEGEIRLDQSFVITAMKSDIYSELVRYVSGL